MAYETIRYELADGLLTITLNRPEQLNAFTPTMAEELIDAFGRASADDAVRAVIVTGAGKAFCAGMDLSAPGNVFGLDESQRPSLEDMYERLEDPAIVRGVRDTGGRVVLSIFECIKPVIAAINRCRRRRRCNDDVADGYPHRLRQGAHRFRVRQDRHRSRGVLLPRIVGMSQALEWVYTADVFDAAEAQRGGLVRAVVEPDRLMDEARRIARRFVENRSPVAVALARQMLYRNSAQAHPLEAHRIDSLAMFYTSIGDGKEGVAAFLEKRAAQFRARVSRDMPPFYAEWIEATSKRKA